MHRYSKLKARILSTTLSAAMAITMMPMNVFAAASGATPDVSPMGTIQSFDRLDSRFLASTGKGAPAHIYALSVELGTPEEELNLPTELTAMVARTSTADAPREDEEAVDSDKGDEPDEDVIIPDEEETIPVEDDVTDGNADNSNMDTGNTDNSNTDNSNADNSDADNDDTISDNQPDSSSDTQEKAEEEIVTEEITESDIPLAPEPEQPDTVETMIERETIPVTWNSSEEYKADENGKFIYTAEIGEEYILADGVQLPQIYVIVGRQARSAELKQRTDALDLSTSATITWNDNTTGGDPTKDNLDAMDAEGWKWYCTAADGYAAKTLVLNGLDLETAALTAVRLPAGTTVIVEGTNTIISTNQVIGNNESNNSSGMKGLGELNFSGKGVLEVTSGKGYNTYGIYSESGGINVKDVTLKATAQTAGSNENCYGVCASTGDITVSGKGNLTGVFTQGSYGGGIWVKSGSIDVSDEGKMTGNGGKVSNSNYGIRVSGNITVSGTGTLTGITGIKGNYCYGVYSEGGNITISDSGKLTGTGTPLDSSNQAIYGVYASGKLTISGTGSLTGTAAESKVSRGVYVKDITVSDTGSLTGTAVSGNDCYGAFTWNTGGITVSGGTLMVAGAVQAVNIKPVITGDTDAIITASKDVNGTSPTDNISGNITQYKYIKIFIPVLENYTGPEAAAPKMSAKTERSVTLEAVTVADQVVEYAKNFSNTAPQNRYSWQTDTTFTNLSDDTSYYFFARVKANNKHKAGTASAGTEIKTNKDYKGIVENAKMMVDLALSNLTATNDTNDSELMALVNKEIIDGDFSGVTAAWKSGNGFNKVNATTSADGSITGTIVLTLNSATVEVILNLQIAQLTSDEGSSGSSSTSGGSSSGNHIITSVPPSYQGATKVIRNVSVPDYTIEGNWKKDANGNWSFSGKDGTEYVKCWAPIFNPYANVTGGQSAFDWFLFDDKGNIRTGWYTDTDGNTYYLNPNSDNTLGAMQTGWVEINGIYYYFNEVSDGTRGKLLRGTKTPDGYRVDENGAWDGKS